MNKPQYTTNNVCNTKLTINQQNKCAIIPVAVNMLRRFHFRRRR